MAFKTSARSISFVNDTMKEKKALMIWHQLRADLLFLSFALSTFQLQLISIPKIRLRFKNSDFCVIFMSLWPDATSFFLQNLEKFHPKNVQPLLEAKVFKILNKLLNMDPSSDCFLCACQIWTWYDHWETLKIGSAPLYRSYCSFVQILISFFYSIFFGFYRYLQCLTWERWRTN